MTVWVLEAKTSEGNQTGLYYIPSPQLFATFEATEKFDSKEEANSYRDRMMIKDKKVRHFVPTEFDLSCNSGFVRKF